MTFPDVARLLAGFTGGDFPDIWQAAYVQWVQVRLCRPLMPELIAWQSMEALCGTIVVFIGGLALYTQVDASQRVPVFNKSDNILAAC